MSPHTKKTNDIAPAKGNLTFSTLRRYSTQILLVILIALTAGAISRAIWNNPLSVDSYTHIAIGEYILQTGTIPSHRDLSYKITDPSLEWISHSWLSDILLYMGQSISLHAGILTLLLPLLVLSGYLTFLLIPKPRFTLPKIILFALTMIITAGFWRYHPFIFMVPLQLMLMILISEWDKGNYRVAYFIPIVFWIWANMAGGYIIIPALYCILAGIAAMLKQRIDKQSPHHNVKAYAIAVLIGMLLTLLNPYGARIWMYWMTVIAVVYQNRSFSSLIGALSTYNQTSARQVYSSLYLVLFMAFTGILCVGVLSSLIRSGRSALLRVIPYIPHLLLMTLGYFWVRFIPFSIIILLPMAASGLLIQDTSPISRPKMNTWIHNGLMTVFIVLLLGIIITPPNTPAPRTPIALAKIVKEVNVPENILTTYDNTGFIMYTNPEYKVLLDAQDDLMDDNSLITNYQPVGNFTSAFLNISDAQNIRTAIISRDVSGLSQTLAADEDWALIYFDDNGAVFVERNTLPENKLATLELTHVDLEKNLGFSADTATQSAQELEAFISRYPENYFAIGQLATVYRITKNYDLARQRLLSIPKPLWTFATYTELGRLEAAVGKCKSAEDAFLTALSYRNEKNYSRTVLDIAVLYAGCLEDTAKAKHFFQRYNSFLVTTEEREKLNTLTKQFGIDFID